MIAAMTNPPATRMTWNLEVVYPCWAGMEMHKIKCWPLHLSSSMMTETKS